MDDSLIVVTFTLRPEMVYRAQLAVTVARLRLRYLIGGAVVGLAALALIAIDMSVGTTFAQAVARNAVVVIALPLALLVGAPLGRRLAMRRSMHSSPAIGQRTYTFRDVGVEMTSPLSEGRFTWAAVVSATETREMYLLFLSDAFAHFIPKSAFAAATERTRFESLLARKIPGFRH